MGSEEVNVWIARPQEVSDAQMHRLELTLDESERERAEKFRFERDRRAYVVAHGVRRIALGDFLGADPVSLVIIKKSNGQPVLSWPPVREVFFSHAHTRDLIAFALTSASPIGIDVECSVQSKPDLELLAPYVMLPEAGRRAEELGIDPAAQFFFYWTALEAFWKAAGKGLSPANPRICCTKNDAGTFDITLEGDFEQCRRPPVASVSRIEAPEGCVISLAQHYPQQLFDRADARSPATNGKCRKKDDFCTRTKRHRHQDFVNIISV